MQVKCPKCTCLLKIVNDQHQNKQIRCPKCGQILKLKRSAENRAAHQVESATYFWPSATPTNPSAANFYQNQILQHQNRIKHTTDAKLKQKREDKTQNLKRVGSLLFYTFGAISLVFGVGGGAIYLAMKLSKSSGFASSVASTASSSSSTKSSVSKKLDANSFAPLLAGAWVYPSVDKGGTDPLGRSSQTTFNAGAKMYCLSYQPTEWKAKTRLSEKDAYHGLFYIKIWDEASQEWKIQADDKGRGAWVVRNYNSRENEAKVTLALDFGLNNDARDVPDLFKEKGYRSWEVSFPIDGDEDLIEVGSPLPLFRVIEQRLPIDHLVSIKRAYANAVANGRYLAGTEKFEE